MTDIDKLLEAVRRLAAAWKVVEAEKRWIKASDAQLRYSGIGGQRFAETIAQSEYLMDCLEAVRHLKECRKALAAAVEKENTDAS